MITSHLAGKVLREILDFEMLWLEIQPASAAAGASRCFSPSIFQPPSRKILPILFSLHCLTIFVRQVLRNTDSGHNASSYISL